MAKRNGPPDHFITSNHNILWNKARFLLLLLIVVIVVCLLTDDD